MSVLKSHGEKELSGGRIQIEGKGKKQVAAGGGSGGWGL